MRTDGGAGELKPDWMERAKEDGGEMEEGGGAAEGMEG